MSIDRERVEAFLKALTKLTAEHGIYIAGCGCCGSPWLTDEPGKGHYEMCHLSDEDLTWVKDREE